MKYRNLSVVSKSYYGVTFLPGQVKAVPGYIHDRYFEKVTETNENLKASESTGSTRSKQKQELRPNIKKTDMRLTKQSVVDTTGPNDNSEETTTQVEAPTNLKSENSKED